MPFQSPVWALLLKREIGLLGTVGGVDLEGMAFEVAAQREARRFRIVDDQSGPVHRVFPPEKRLVVRPRI